MRRTGESRSERFLVGELKEAWEFGEDVGCRPGAASGYGLIDVS